MSTSINSNHEELLKQISSLEEENNNLKAFLQGLGPEAKVFDFSSAEIHPQVDVEKLQSDLRGISEAFENERSLRKALAAEHHQFGRDYIDAITENNTLKNEVNLLKERVKELENLLKTPEQESKPPRTKHTLKTPLIPTRGEEDSTVHYFLLKDDPQSDRMKLEQIQHAIDIERGRTGFLHDGFTAIVDGHSLDGASLQLNDRMLRGISSFTPDVTSRFSIGSIKTIKFLRSKLYHTRSEVKRWTHTTTYEWCDSSLHEKTSVLREYIGKDIMICTSLSGQNTHSLPVCLTNVNEDSACFGTTATAKTSAIHAVLRSDVHTHLKSLKEQDQKFGLYERTRERIMGKLGGERLEDAIAKHPFAETPQEKMTHTSAIDCYMNVYEKLIELFSNSITKNTLKGQPGGGGNPQPIEYIERTGMFINARTGAIVESLKHVLCKTDDFPSAGEFLGTVRKLFPGAWMDVSALSNEHKTQLIELIDSGPLGFVLDHSHCYHSRDDRWIETAFSMGCDTRTINEFESEVSIKRPINRVRSKVTPEKGLKLTPHPSVSSGIRGIPKMDLRIESIRYLIIPAAKNLTIEWKTNALEHYLTGTIREETINDQIPFQNAYGLAGREPSDMFPIPSIAYMISRHKNRMMVQHPEGTEVLHGPIKTWDKHEGRWAHCDSTFYPEINPYQGFAPCLGKISSNRARMASPLAFVFDLRKDSSIESSDLTEESSDGGIVQEVSKEPAIKK